jgi:hypothetical protein
MSTYSASSISDNNCYICEDPSRHAHKATCRCRDRYFHIRCLLEFKTSNNIRDTLKCEICNYHYRGGLKNKIKSYETRRISRRRDENPELEIETRRIKNRKIVSLLIVSTVVYFVIIMLFLHYYWILPKNIKKSQIETVCIANDVTYKIAKSRIIDGNIEDAFAIIDAEGYIRGDTKSGIRDLTKLFNDELFTKKEPIILVECVYSEKYNYIAKDESAIEKKINGGFIAVMAIVFGIPYTAILIASGFACS